VIRYAATDGEKLCNFINNRLLALAPWESLAFALRPTGRNEDLVAFYREITAVGLTGRLVSAGLSIADSFATDDPLFRKEFTELLREHTSIPQRDLDELFRFAQRAIQAALEPLTKSFRTQMRNYSQRSHPKCYMCGTQLDFESDDTNASYTCEHVWPRAYGGNSIVENLLPACKACNSVKKGSFATWVMPAIQSLILGLSPSEDRLQEISGSFKFAIHYRAAQRVAIRQNLSLKDAFLQLGPWQTVRIRELGDVVDGFNLENHDTERAVA
jgi:hypothetical protein